MEKENISSKKYNLIGAAILLGFLMLAAFISLLFDWIQVRLFAREGMLFFAPTEEAFYNSRVLLLIISAFGILSLYSIIKKNKFAEIFYKKTVHKIGVAVLGIIFLVYFVGSFFNYTVFLKDKIYYRSVLDLSGRYYSYSDVVKISATYYEGKYFSGLRYELLFKDGKEINATSDEENIKYIPLIEGKVDEKVERYIDKKAYDYLKHKIFTEKELTELFNKKY